MDYIETSMVIDDNIDILMIISDENRLKRIILNFVLNAYIFTKFGKIKKSFHLYLYFRQNVKLANL